jgi:hypothetical protein
MKNLKSIALVTLFSVFLIINTPAISSLPDFTTLAEDYSSSVVNVSVVRKQKEKDNSKKNETNTTWIAF